MDHGRDFEREQWLTMLEKSNQMISEIPVVGHDGIPLIDRGQHQLEVASSNLWEKTTQDHGLSQSRFNALSPAERASENVLRNEGGISLNDLPGGNIGKDGANQKFLLNRASQLLGQYNFDVNKLERELNQLLPRTATENAKDIEYDYHRQVICTAVHEAISSSVSATEHQIQRQLESDWDSEKHRLLAELERLDNIKNAPIDSRKPNSVLAIQDLLSSNKTPFLSAFGVSSDVAGAGGPGAIASFALVGDEAARTYSFLSALNEGGVNIDRPEDLVSAFRNRVMTVQDSLPSSEQLWKLVEDLCSSIEPNSGESTSVDMGWLCGARNFLEEQYARNIIGRKPEEKLVIAVARWLDTMRIQNPLRNASGIRNELWKFSPAASGLGSTGSGSFGGDFGIGKSSWMNSFKNSSVSNQLATKDSLSSPGGSNGVLLTAKEPFFSLDGIDPLPLWAVVYYCIRAGGWIDAVEILEKQGRAEDDIVTKLVVSALKSMASESKDDYTESVLELSGVLKSGEINDKKGIETVEGVNPSGWISSQHFSAWKKAVVYLLLNGKDPSLFPRLVNASVQDYMWMKLSVIIAMNLVPSFRSEQQENLGRLQETLLRNGPEHFSDGNDPLVYARILIMAKLPWEAIYFLSNRSFSETDGRFQPTTLITDAVHVGLCLAKMLSVDELSEFARIVSRYSKRFLVNTGKIQEKTPDLSGCNNAFLYMGIMWKLAKRRLAKQAMLVTVDGLANLLLDERFDFRGNEKGAVGGHSPDYFVALEGFGDQELVKEVLRYAGELAYSRGAIFESLDLLLYNATNVEKAVNILNKQLIQAIRPPHLHRSRWLQEAARCEERIPELNASTKEPYSTFRILSKMLLFTLDLDEKRWHDAVSRVNGLLPASSSEVSGFIKDHLSLSDLVLEVFPLIFAGALEAHKALFDIYAGDRRIIAELQDRFRAYELFNASLPESSPRIAQMIARFSA